MDIWSITNPFLKTLLYLSLLGTVGTLLFSLHFSKYQSLAGVRYCQSLINKSASLGIIVSLGTFFSVAGNMGGDFVSAIDMIMLRLAFESKVGLASLIALLGFVILRVTNKSTSQLGFVISLIGLILVLLSFVISGHSTKDGFITQSLLLIHLVGISYWLGSLLPFSWMCISDDDENLYIITHRFGVLAIGYIMALMISGFIFAYHLIGSFYALINTSYGNVLLAKLVAVFLILSLGALNKFKLVPLLIKNPTVGAKRLRSSVNFEILLALIILGFSSLLTTSLTLPMGI
ncbi:MAG: copper resistance D family protein [Paracoccaceae bacterium]